MDAGGDRVAPDPATLAVAAGRGPGQPGDPLNVPPVLASVYRSGEDVGYGREHNPTWAALETALGALEGGIATVFASGMSAVGAVLAEVGVGGAVVVPRDAYIGTRALLADHVARGLLTVRPVDIADTPAVLAAAAGADLLWVETLTNPLLAVADVQALCDGARRLGVRTAVDSTFATPLGQQPLALGADVVVHSATKAISGHSDVLLGAVVVSDEQQAEVLRLRRTLGGAVPGPLEAWLALRGLRTLPVRYERMQANAAELARRLADHPGVSRVRYPGLPGDPGHARAAAQLRGGFGAIVSFEVGAGRDAADAVCAATRLIVHATSLGGVETTMERRQRYPGEETTPPALIRLSAGCEHVEDLWADLSQALDTGGRDTGGQDTGARDTGAQA
jgi:cystathionine gamma-synthase